MTVYLNIGSNLFNRLNNLIRAIELIKKLEFIDIATLKVSNVIETDAWGYESVNKFLNIGISFNCNSIVSPEVLLNELKNIESIIGKTTPHRDRNNEYQDRIIDIDIIAIDDLCYRSETLVIPHPKMHLRKFVVLPMLELNPKWIHPELGETWKNRLIISNDDIQSIRVMNDL